MRKTATMAKRALRIKDAAAYLSVSPACLRNLVQKGELPIVKLCEGQRVPWLLDVEDLNRLVERRKETLQ